MILNTNRKLRVVDNDKEDNRELAKRLIKNRRKKPQPGVVNTHTSDDPPKPTLLVDEVLDKSYWHPEKEKK